MTVYNDIDRIISTLSVENISDARKEILKPLVDFIQLKVNTKQDIRINFICTHNSRRSHLSQIWAQTMAHYFNIKNVFCYSGAQRPQHFFQ
ncbi:arsenate reductase [Algibacter lectus]|uniref:Arsenate reductase n=1 Tax=Algibacter lectus TaxID=221126 RepID=A0A090WXB9_9FLAO|nr:arsenate reductase [Algibacter lectus]